MGTVHRLDAALDIGSAGPGLGDAVTAFLRVVTNTNTALGDQADCSTGLGRTT